MGIVLVCWSADLPLLSALLLDVASARPRAPQIQAESSKQLHLTSCLPRQGPGVAMTRLGPCPESFATGD